MPKPINPKIMMIVVVFIFFGFFEDFLEDRWGIAPELLSFMMDIPTMMASVFLRSVLSQILKNKK